MLKLSLGLRITNSRRENLRKELHRGVEVHRLLRSGLAKQWQATHPGFDIVRDPAWLAVDGPDGGPVPGLDVMIRHNPFHPADDVSCVAGLVSPRPHPLAPPPDRGRRLRGPGWPTSSPVSPDEPAARAAPSPPSGSCATWSRSYGPCSGWTARRHRPGGAPAEHPAPAGRRRLAQGRPLPRQPGLLLPRVPARRTRRPAARHRRAQRHLRLRRGHRRTLRLLPRHQQRARPHRRVRLPAPRRRTTAARRLPPLPRDIASGPARLRTTLPALCSTHPSCAARPTCSPACTVSTNSSARSTPSPSTSPSPTPSIADSLPAAPPDRTPAPFTPRNTTHPISREERPVPPADASTDTRTDSAPTRAARTRWSCACPTSSSRSSPTTAPAAARPGGHQAPPDHGDLLDRIGDWGPGAPPRARSTSSPSGSSGTSR